MTNPLNGQELKMPTPVAVVEHIATVPMFIAALASLCGWIAAAGYFAAESPNQRLLLQLSAGLPLLSTQLAQMWHSRNVRNKMAVANRATPPQGVTAHTGEGP
jgi:hypothetical protein